MKTKTIALIMSCVVLLCISMASYAKSGSTEERARIGVLIDSKPLPDLLVKHLRLSPDQGVRISNVQRNSPADKAGLERDDIIIGFQDEKIRDFEQLVDMVQEAGVGSEVSMEIIHLGERKTVRLQLEALQDEPELKYPHEPQIFQSWRPGRMFRFKPGEKEWMEIELPFDGKSLDVYNFHHSDDGEGYSIAIEGSPDDEDTKVTVRIGPDEYKTTVGEIDKLPEKHREAAEEALKNSRKYSDQSKKVMTGKYDYVFKPYEAFKHLNKKVEDELMKHLREHRIIIHPDDPNDLLKNLQEHLHKPDLPKFGPDNKMFDRIEEQMRKLQERIEELEKRFGEIPERSSRKTEQDQI